MSIVTRDGFKFHDGLLSDYIVIEDKRIEDYVDYINKNRIKCISIIPHLAYNKEDVNFLKDCTNIEHVNIASSIINDFSGLYYLKNLKVLAIDEPKSEIDLKKTPNLIKFSAVWNKNIKNLEYCSKIERIGLSKFNPKSNNFESLSILENLKELIIIKSTINSFNGLDKLKKIEKIDFSYLKNLELIDELEDISLTLKHLRFDNCKNIKNHNYVTCLKELELLSFDNCGDIPSIKFIKELPKLKTFIFIGSNILDGDLFSCENLEYVRFSDKKHYSHKLEYFKK